MCENSRILCKIIYYFRKKQSNLVDKSLKCETNRLYMNLLFYKINLI